MITHSSRRFLSKHSNNILFIIFCALSLIPLSPINGHTAELPLILLDPGHGGHDRGAVSTTGIQEKNVTLKTAIAAAKHIKKYYNTELTRSGDYPVSQDARIEKAIRTQASLFISFHLANGLSPDKEQITIFYSEPDTPTETVSLRPDESRKLAESIRKRFLAIPAIKRVDIFNARIFLLTNLNIPGVLIEIGNINPSHSGKQVEPDAFTDNVGKRLSEGIHDYFEK